MKRIWLDDIYLGFDEQHLSAAIVILYELLRERTPEQSISHKEMPTFEQHKTFVKSKPYNVWYLIKNDAGEFIGSSYLTHQREIGIFIFNRFQGQGYGEEAIRAMMAKHPGKILANVNPSNEPSQHLFEKLGGKLIQITYEIG